ncbi:hypothetical protein WJX72_002165 [[Myrmecia] bisecta]|uniref:C2 domain-containing protein n=1 Tax=[Myrmecia] bisecta TaxID=41462 RepID=A0AAW1PIJ5_9CHLO
MQVTIVCAKGLRDTAVFGVQDPFVVVHYGNLKFKTRKHRGGGTAPIWQETLTLPTQHGSPSKISLEIKNAGVLKADKVGTAEVSLDRAFNAGSDEVDAPVHTKDGRQQGEIQIALKFAPGDESSAVASTSAPAFPHSHSAPSALGDTHGQAVVEPSRAHKQSLEQDQGCAGPLGAGIAALSSDKSRPSFTGRPSPVKQSPRSMVEAVHATPSAPPMSALDAAYSAPSALPSQHGQADQQDMHRSSSQYAALHVTAAEPHADAAQADAHRHNAAIHGGSQVPQEGLPHKLLSSAPETAFVHAHASGISHYALDSTASV